MDSWKNGKKLNLIGIHIKTIFGKKQGKKEDNLIAQIDLQQRKESLFCTLEKSLCSETYILDSF